MESRRAYRVLGSAFLVASDVPGFVEAVDRVWGAFAGPVRGRLPTYVLHEDPGARHRFGLELDGRTLVRTSRPEACLELLGWHVTHRAIGGVRHRALVHAGVVSLGARAVVLPGASGSGKTTLVAGLVAAGFSFLSDEIADIDPRSGRVAPFPRALGLTGPARLLLPQPLPDPPRAARRFLGDEPPVPAAEIGAASPGAPAPVGLIVAPRYRAGARTRLVPIGRSEGVLELAAHAFNLEAVGGLEGLERATRGARCYRLESGRLEEAVDAIRAVAEEAAGGPEGEVVSIAERVVVSPAWGRFSGERLDPGVRVRRGDLIGRVAEAGRSVSLVAHAPGSFLSWLVEEGERVAPGRPVARLRAGG